MKSYAQEDNTPVGIYDLYLGMTVDEMKAVVDTAQLRDDPLIKTARIYKIYGDRATGYLIKPYATADGYDIEELGLTFFDNRLLRIATNKPNHDLENYIHKKYGEKYGFSEGETSFKGDIKTVDWFTNRPGTECLLVYRVNDDGKYSIYQLSITDKKLEESLYEAEIY